MKLFIGLLVYLFNGLLVNCNEKMK